MGDKKGSIDCFNAWGFQLIPQDLKGREGSRRQSDRKKGRDRRRK